MDIGALATGLATFLAPFLPSLAAAGRDLTEEAARSLGSQAGSWAASIWRRLRPAMEAHPAAIEAASDVARAPADELAQAALAQQIKKLLTNDEHLAEELQRMVAEAKGAGVTVIVSGDRSVGIGGNAVGNTINTGDQERSTRPS